MAVISGQTLTISANGDSDSLELTRGVYLVTVFYEAGVTANVVCKRGPNEARLVAFIPPSGEVTGSSEFLINAPGVLGFTVSALAGGNIIVSIAEADV